MHKQKIVTQFNRGAIRYDQQAIIQKQVATYLYQLMHANHGPQYNQQCIATICDVGCGTGFLTEYLCRTFTQSHVTAMDIAPQMLQQCAAKLRNYPNLDMVLFDMEQSLLPRKFDLVTSSLALQWVSNLCLTVQRLWEATQKWLCFSILCQGTFYEWQNLFKTLALPEPSLRFISLDQLTSVLQQVTSDGSAGDSAVQIHQQQLTQNFTNIHAFLRHIKSIGVHYSPYADHTDAYLSAKRLRHIIKAESKQNFTLTYKVVYCLLKKEQ